MAGKKYTRYTPGRRRYTLVHNQLYSITYRVKLIKTTDYLRDNIFFTQRKFRYCSKDEFAVSDRS